MASIITEENVEFKKLVHLYKTDYLLNNHRRISKNFKIKVKEFCDTFNKSIKEFYNIKNNMYLQIVNIYNYAKKIINEKKHYIKECNEIRQRLLRLFNDSNVHKDLSKRLHMYHYKTKVIKSEYFEKYNIDIDNSHEYVSNVIYYRKSWIYNSNLIDPFIGDTVEDLSKALIFDISYCSKNVIDITTMIAYLTNLKYHEIHENDILYSFDSNNDILQILISIYINCEHYIIINNYKHWFIFHTF